MEFNKLQARALEVREKYQSLEMKKFGKSWTTEQIALGLVGDVGDLMKLVLAKEGVRIIENADEKLSHELSDCLWCLLVLSKAYDVDLESEFLHSMDALQDRIQSESTS